MPTFNQSPCRAWFAWISVTGDFAVDCLVVPSLTDAQRNAVAQLMQISEIIDVLGEQFAAAGHQLFLVGGSVRDAMLGRLGHDLDFTTSAPVAESERILKAFTPATWDMGRDFGTIGALHRGQDAEWVIEVTTFRADAYDPESRKPTVEFATAIEADLVRRDFTVNAMAIEVTNKQFVDPFDGLSDLAAGRLRTPAEPEVSFSDDPLRMMRAARFASRLGFTLVPEAEAAMVELADRIEIVSAERVQAELNGLLLTDSPRAGLDLLVRTGITDHVLPELSELCKVTDEHFRHKDVYQHSLTVLDQSIALEKQRGHEPDLVGRLAALLHDIGKPATRRFEGSKVTFHHHDVVGAKLAKKRLNALRYPSAVTKSVAKLIELHLRFHGYGEASWSDWPFVAMCETLATNWSGYTSSRVQTAPPETATRPPGCGETTKSWSGGSTNSPKPRNSTRSVLTLTAPKSWKSWGFHRAEAWARHIATCWTIDWSMAPKTKPKPRGRCWTGGHGNKVDQRSN